MRDTILNRLAEIEAKVLEYDNRIEEVNTLIAQSKSNISDLENEYAVTGAIGDIDRNLQAVEALEVAKGDLARQEATLEAVTAGRIQYIKVTLDGVYPEVTALQHEVNTELSELSNSFKEQVAKLHNKLDKDRDSKVAMLEEVKNAYTALGCLIPEPEVTKHSDRINHLTHYNLYYVNAQDGRINKLLNQLKGLVV